MLDKYYFQDNLSTTYYNNLYLKEDGINSQVVLRGLIFVKRAIVCFGTLFLTIDNEKSDRELVKKFEEIEDFLEIYCAKFSYKNSFIEKIDNGDIHLTIKMNEKDTISLIKPYKIPFTDITEYRNYYMLITTGIGLYLLKDTLPKECITKFKHAYIMIPYDPIIYTRYGIDSENNKNDYPKIIFTDNTFRTKKETVERIMKIMNK
jgi:hypothetical protein